MHTGIDLGSTLIKVAYQTKKQLNFLSTADYSMAAIANILKKNNITSANAVGINAVPKELRFLKIKKNKKNIIQHEIKTQVKGLKYLAEIQKLKLPRNFILVSIGTGISYTIIKNKTIKKIPIGSSIGGGTILGLAKAAGIKDYHQLVSLAKAGDHKKTDIYFQDLIVSNLAKVSQKTAKCDIAAGLMNLLAITIYKDLILYKIAKQDIIIIGSALKKNIYLKKLLKKYINKPFFMPNSEYSSCVGAWLSHGN